MFLDAGSRIVFHSEYKVIFWNKCARLFFVSYGINNDPGIFPSSLFHGAASFALLPKDIVLVLRNIFSSRDSK